MTEVLIIAFAAMFCWGIADFLIQRSTRVMGNIEALAWIGLIGSVGLLPFVVNDLHLLSTTQNMLIFGILGLVAFASALFDFEALRIGKLSIIDMVISLELPFTIILGILFLGDRLTIWQFVFVLFLMWGVSLLSVTRTPNYFKLEKGVWMAIAAAITFAFVNFFTAVAAVRATPILAIWVPWVIFTILCLGVMLRRHSLRSFTQHARNYYGLIIAMGIIDTAAWIFYAKALVIGELSIVTAITESYPAIAVLLGVWLNRERIAGYQWLGVVVALAASFVLALTL